MAAGLMCVVGQPTPAWSQATGVSDDRVSLPEGPGSLEGVGENISLNANMGTMQYGVPIVLPQGFASASPSLNLSYNSGGGGSVVGMGWTLPMPSIERMTYRGLPDYDLDDDFCLGGSDQIVRIPDTEPPVYRARYEGSFVRYTWHDAGDGSEGYWTAEYPDGSVGYFGADRNGTAVDRARLSGDEGTFRYHLVEKVDVYGHTLRYTYGKYGVVPLVEQIGYVYLGGEEPRYQVTFEYEAREDNTGADNLSDAKAGFEELLTVRLARINVLSGQARIRFYELSYESYEAAGGFTRLTQVQMHGQDGSAFAANHTFDYSQALGAECEGGMDCEQPYVVTMGSLGVNIQSGQATLIDINGDALPDVVQSPPEGNHRFFINVPDVEGNSRFDLDAVTSAVGDNTFQLSSPYVQVLDINGDGFTDIFNARTASALLNRGQGDWSDMPLSVSASSLPDFDNDFDLDDEEGLQTIRFLDVDNDKRIDVLRALNNNTRLFLNRSSSGFVEADDVQQLGASFDTDNLELTDMNGDGLLDVVRPFVDRLEYRLNLGRGRWGDWKTVSGASIVDSAEQLKEVKLEDLNGDGLSDMLLVQGSTVRYAINRNSESFAASATLTSAEVEGDLPQADQDTTVLVADMNANGSQDVVWIDQNGAVTYLELFPVRPNLMTKVTNGLGFVQEVVYGTSVEHMARAGGTDAWQFRLPHPMVVVDRTDVYDLLTGSHEVTEYRYEDGFYNGDEKQFRGYVRVEAFGAGDEHQEDGLSVSIFDVGAVDNHRHGLLLESTTTSGSRVLSTSQTTYEKCTLAGIEGAEDRVRYFCPVATRKTLIEGADEGEHVVVETRSTYDGYGNVIRSEDFGVTSIGGQDCAPCQREPSLFGEPCGAQCSGDEQITETDFVLPSDTNGRWLISAPYRVRTYGREGSNRVSETLTYYDGPDFEGLALGRLDQGKVSRVTTRVDEDSERVIQTARNKHDEHGNVIETLDPLGEVGGNAHRRIYTYDDERLRVERTDLLVLDEAGSPYRLRRETRYEDLFDKLVESTAWMRVVEGEVLSGRRSSFFAYDSFARLVSIVRPGGDTLESPSEVFTYELASPTSRIIAQRRSQVGGPLDIETITCTDGRGRAFQKRTRLTSGSYQVSGFTLFNERSAPIRVFQPYLSDTGQCDEAPPQGVLSVATQYDAAFRPIQRTLPDADIYGEASITRTEYRPLEVLSFDSEDADPSSAHTNTPTLQRVDGLGRVTKLERFLTPNLSAGLTIRYDELGHLHGYVDAEGNEKIQENDLLGRVLTIEDPNMGGQARFEYDDASNLTLATDPRGVSVRTEFDGLNRPVARFDEASPDTARIQWRYDFVEGCDACTNTEGLRVQSLYPLPDGQTGVDSVGYDVRGRAVSVTRDFGIAALTRTVTHDNINRVISTTYPDGRTIERRYDDASRLREIVDLVHTITYDDRSLIAEVGCADGSGTAMTHDSRMRLSRTTTTDSVGQIIQGFGYTRDRVGNLLAIEDLSSNPLPGASAAMSSVYDAWYRVLSTELGSDDAENLSFEHDIIDNLTAITSDLGSKSGAHIGQLVYDGQAPNAVMEAGGLAFGYDAMGNTTQRGEQTLQWDFLGRLTAVDQGGEAPPVESTYGSDHMRVMKRSDGSVTHYLSGDYELRDGIATLYVRTGRKRVARIQSTALATEVLSDVAPVTGPDGAIRAADAYTAWAAGEGIVDGIGSPSEPASLLWSSVRRLMAEESPGVVYLHHDHLGSITAATSGEVLGRRAFYPQGGVRAEQGFVDVYGFTGQEHEGESGLIHFAHRFLDPNTGRWLSVDPLFRTSTPGLLSRHGESSTAYAYVAGNFVNAVDPTGLAIRKRANSAPQKSAAKKTRARSASVGSKSSSTALRRNTFGKLKRMSALKIRKVKVEAAPAAPATPPRNNNQPRRLTFGQLEGTPLRVQASDKPPALPPRRAGSVPVKPPRPAKPALPPRSPPALPPH